MMRFNLAWLLDSLNVDIGDFGNVLGMQGESKQSIPFLAWSLLMEIIRDESKFKIEQASRSPALKSGSEAKI